MVTNIFPHINMNNNLLFKQQKDSNSEQTVIFPEGNSVYSATKCVKSDRLKGEEYNRRLGRTLEKCDKENLTAHTGRQKYNDDNHYQTSNRKIIYNNKCYEMESESSYICQPINNKRDRVRINDVDVKNNLILSCRPRTYNEPKNLHMKSAENDSSIDGYIHPCTEEEIKGDILYEERNYGYRQKPYEQTRHTNSDGSTLIRHDTLDIGASLYRQEHFDHVKLDGHQQSGDKSEVKRVMQCTKLTKEFKGFLWLLFFINIFVVASGIILLSYTLPHFVSRNYMNIVIEQTGFVAWFLVVVIISVFIIIVGSYGIIASVDRGKRILILYSVIAFILASMILVFLIVLWFIFINMKDVVHSSMTNTINMYRCHRYIRNAWDDLQETHKCCGIKDSGDWKYIPPSCCNGVSKQEKLACVKHYIKENQSFQDGCRSKLEDYFSFFFFVIACLLLLAIIFLLLGACVSLWLWKKYKKVLKCQEVYYITK